MEQKKSFICIDLKSFYASVECVERGLDPFKTNLVVADPSRSKSTICLAITPAMKSQGVKNRCRIHEIPEGLEYITAMPRMQLYIDYSARICSIYENRPLLCRIDESYEIFFKSKLSYDEYIKLNYESCKILKGK